LIPCRRGDVVDRLLEDVSEHARVEFTWTAGRRELVPFEQQEQLPHHRIRHVELRVVDRAVVPLCRPEQPAVQIRQLRVLCNRLDTPITLSGWLVEHAEEQRFEIRLVQRPRHDRLVVFDDDPFQQPLLDEPAVFEELDEDEPVQQLDCEQPNVVTRRSLGSVDPVTDQTLLWGVPAGGRLSEHEPDVVVVELVGDLGSPFPDRRSGVAGDAHDVVERESGEEPVEQLLRVTRRPPRWRGVPAGLIVEDRLDDRAEIDVCERVERVAVGVVGDECPLEPVRRDAEGRVERPVGQPVFHLPEPVTVLSEPLVHRLGLDQESSGVDLFERIEGGGVVRLLPVAVGSVAHLDRELVVAERLEQRVEKRAFRERLRIFVVYCVGLTERVVAGQQPCGRLFVGECVTEPRNCVRQRLSDAGSCRWIDRRVDLLCDEPRL